MSSSPTDLSMSDLVLELQEYYEALIACEPHTSEYAMHDFIEIQEWGEALGAKVIAHGFTWEQIEDAAD